jgi:hypothetical protein
LNSEFYPALSRRAFKNSWLTSMRDGRREGSSQDWRERQAQRKHVPGLSPLSHEPLESVDRTRSSRLKRINVFNNQNTNGKFDNHCSADQN